MFRSLSVTMNLQTVPKQSQRNKFYINYQLATHKWMFLNSKNYHKRNFNVRSNQQRTILIFRILLHNSLLSIFFGLFLLPLLLHIAGVYFSLSKRNASIKYAQSGTNPLTSMVYHFIMAIVGCWISVFYGLISYGFWLIPFYTKLNTSNLNNLRFNPMGWEWQRNKKEKKKDLSFMTKYSCALWFIWFGSHCSNRFIR